MLERPPAESRPLSCIPARSRISAEEAQRALKDMVFARWLGQGCEERSDTLKMVRRAGRRGRGRSGPAGRCVPCVGGVAPACSSAWRGSAQGALAPATHGAWPSPTPLPPLPSLPFIFYFKTNPQVGLVSFFLPFFPLERRHLRQLFEMQLGERGRALAGARLGALQWDPAVVDFLLDKASGRRLGLS